MTKTWFVDRDPNTVYVKRDPRCPVSHVYELIAQAAKTDNQHLAMQLSQAALNCANAIAKIRESADPDFGG